MSDYTFCELDAESSGLQQDVVLDWCTSVPARDSVPGIDSRRSWLAGLTSGSFWQEPESINEWPLGWSPSSKRMLSIVALWDPSVLLQNYTIHQPGRCDGLDPLTSLITELAELAYREPEEDDLGRNRPTFYSLRSALKFCADSAFLIRQSGPSDIYVDRNGDIRIEWRHNDKAIEFVFSADANEQSYIYFSSNDTYGTVDGFDRVTAEARFAWLRS